MEGGFVVATVGNEGLQPSKEEDGVSGKDEPQIERKPYSRTDMGRIKLVSSRRFIRITTVDESTTTPWRKDEHRVKDDLGSSLKLPYSTTKNNRINNKNDSSTLWTRLTPFLKRGILLMGLTAVAIIDRSPPPPSVALLPSSTAVTAVGQKSLVSSLSSSFIPRTTLRINWDKLWSLPGEILPSLSAALMIAWVPNLIMQKAWWELGFLVVSLTSQSNLRVYVLSEILPSLGGTVRKLFWSEFWKRTWDYLLEPFPHNLLVPSKPPPSTSKDVVQSKWQQDVSRFWTDRVVSRIDKWTASSVKALLQKSVQSSVNGLAEDSWKAVANAWYPGGKHHELKRGKLPTPEPSNEDTARMIELECEEADDCKDEELALTTEIDEKTDETGANDCDNEAVSDLTSEVQETLGYDEPEEEEKPEVVLN